MDQQQSLEYRLVTGRIELIEEPAGPTFWTSPAPVVRGVDFPPLTEVRVEVSCRDARQRLWKSSNDYLVSADGVFDTSLTASVGQGYYGITREGPIASMVPQDGAVHEYEGAHEFAWRELPELVYEYACYANQELLWSSVCSRAVARAPVNPPAPTVELFYFDDSVNSLEHPALQALAAHGAKVSLEDPRSGQAALEQALPAVIVASGRASGRALEIAIDCPHVSAVVLFSGGGLRFDPFETAATESGEPSRSLQYISLDHASLRPKAEGVLVTRTMYAEAVADRSAREKGRIEVEKIACPIYLFSGLDDQIWPASAFSELIVQRRKTQNCRYPTSHRTFEAVGHDLGPSLGPPSLPTTERTVEHPETGFRLLLGGKPGRQARARRECWESLLKILSGAPLDP